MSSTETEASLSALAPASLRLRASDALRAAIVEGRLAPGDRLKELELAEQLGISRQPVREALRQLEHEGLVASLPYRQTEVLGVSHEEIVEVLVPIRITVETFAFRKALTQLTEADVQELRNEVTKMREAAGSGDLNAVADADVRFHELVIERSGQTHCLQVWRSIEARVRAYFRRDAPTHSPPEEIADTHDELLRALISRDDQQVTAAIQQHILDYLTPRASSGDAAK